MGLMPKDLPKMWHATVFWELDSSVIVTVLTVFVGCLVIMGLLHSVYGDLFIGRIVGKLVD